MLFLRLANFLLPENLIVVFTIDVFRYSHVLSKIHGFELHVTTFLLPFEKPLLQPRPGSYEWKTLTLR